MKLKTKKLVSKRIKVTSKKKMMIRGGGQDHFNSRETGNTTKNKRRDKQLSAVNERAIKKLLPYL